MHILLRGGLGGQIDLRGQFDKLIFMHFLHNDSLAVNLYSGPLPDYL